jgi:hypothetical protein
MITDGNFTSHMRFTFLYFILIVSIVSCRDTANETQWGEDRNPSLTSAYDENDTLAVSVFPSNLKAWMNFYSSIDSGFQNSNFKASGVILHIDSMYNATTASNEKDFKTILAYSPDSSRIVDFWSYMQRIESDDKGNKTITGGSPDQEVILADKKQNSFRQLMYNGTQQIVETADWIDNNSFLLGMLNTNESGTVWIPEIFLFNLQDSTFTNFRLNHEIKTDSMYLKNADFISYWLSTKKITLH